MVIVPKAFPDRLAVDAGFHSEAFPGKYEELGQL
jgi:hypothetical protein